MPSSAVSLRALRLAQSVGDVHTRTAVRKSCKCHGDVGQMLKVNECKVLRSW